MPRTSSIGNGNLLVLFDKKGLVKDLYFPYAGLEEHTLGLKHYIALAVDKKIYWLHNYLVNIKQSSISLKSISTYFIKEENISIKIESIVYNEESIFLRKVLIKNKLTQKRKLKIFFHQAFKITENKFRNTGYYDPHSNSVVHYRGNRSFLVGIYYNKVGLDDYTVGLYNYREYVGSYKNIEQYFLAKNSVEHGPVDSVIAKEFTIPAKKKLKIFYYLAAGKNIKEVKKLQKILLKKTPEHILKTTTDFWHVWSRQRSIDFLGLSKNVENLFYKSLFIIRSHIDSKTGGVIASGDSSTYEFDKDSYAYVWPRDAVYIAISLDKLGYFSLSRNIYNFLISVLEDGGYLLHKYQQDKSLGSSWHSWILNGKEILPIQLDESALLIWGLWNHYQKTKDVEFVEKNFNSAIKKIADFLLRYKNKKLNIPNPSYDIWEEDYANYVYSISSVVGALDSAAKLSFLLKKEVLGEKYLKQSKAYKKSLLEYLYNHKDGYFYKKIQLVNDSLLKDSTPDMSIFFSLWYFNVFDLEDPIVTKEYARVKELLQKESTYFIRYKGDHFLSNTQDENIWIITSLWSVMYDIKRSKNKEELLKAGALLDTIAKLSLTSGVFPEQVSYKGHNPLNVAPLIWSHSCFLETIAEYIEKLEKFGLIKICLPK